MGDARRDTDPRETRRGTLEVQLEKGRINGDNSEWKAKERSKRS